MDCTSDNDVGSSYHPVFVWPTPTTLVIPDDYRLQTPTAESARSNFHRSTSKLCLVPVYDTTQRCSREIASTLCFERSNSTHGLLSVAQYDDRHSNVDAHSFEIQPTDQDYTKNNCAATLGEVYLISVKPDELLSQIRANPSCLDPVPFENHAANSAIEQVTLTGLHNGKSHVSIVEMKFRSGQKIDLSKVKSLTATIPDLNCCSKHKITGSVISHSSDMISTVLKDVLLHMQVFYWRSPLINIQVELLDQQEVDQFSSNSSHTYPTSESLCAHMVVIPPRPLIMSTLPDDDRILHNQQPSDTLVCVSSTEAAKFYIVHSHNNGDAMQTTANQEVNEEMVEVSNTIADEQNNFSINLDCKKLYSIINSQEILPYPCCFRMMWSLEGNQTIPIILRILPLKSGGKHISLWAEILSPVPQCLSLHQITIEATAYNPNKDRDFGQLGTPIRCTEKFSEEMHSRCQVAFDKLMLQMHAFYCKQVLIDIKTY